MPCAGAARPRARSLSPRLSMARDLGPAPSDAPATVLVSLAVRNQASLARFLEEVQDPTSPRYRRFLTPSRFVAPHAPTLRQEHAVVAYLEAHGLHFAYRAPNRPHVGAAGTVAAKHEAFDVPPHKLYASL